MRSAARITDDLTARARIRDSAVVYFGRHGFQSATVRAIAADAGVSPALVIHHFRSKDGLREACDSYVMAAIDELTTHASTHLEPRDLLDMLALTPQLAPLVPYTIQAVSEGGAFAERLWDRLVQDTEAYLRAATAAGVVRPTADQHSRAELLTTFKVGMYLLARYVAPRAASTNVTAGTPTGGGTSNGTPTNGTTATATDGGTATAADGTRRAGTGPPQVDIQSIADRFTVPALELFTHGMFTTTDYLDAFLEHQRKGAAS